MIHSPSLYICFISFHGPVLVHKFQSQKQKCNFLTLCLLNQSKSTCHYPFSNPWWWCLSSPPISLSRSYLVTMPFTLPCVLHHSFKWEFIWCGKTRTVILPIMVSFKQALEILALVLWNTDVRMRLQWWNSHITGGQLPLMEAQLQ